MKFADHLSAADIQKFNQLRKAGRKKKVTGYHPNFVLYDEMHEYPVKPRKENLSHRDIKELMGVNRDRYERRNGAMRRK